MIVVNHDKGFAEMLQHPAFRNRRTRRHPVDVDSSLLAPRRPHADSRLRSDARGCDGGVRQELAAGVNPNTQPRFLMAMAKKPRTYLPRGCGGIFAPGKITQEAPMRSIETDYSATGLNYVTNYWATGTGQVAFWTLMADPVRWAYGGIFQGWYAGVDSAGGAVGPNGEVGPEVNNYSGWCGVLGKGYYVPGVAGTSVYNPGVYGQTESQTTLPDGVIAGVIGTADSQPGVIAWSREGDGVRSVTYTGNGVFAASYYGQAVHGQSGTERGVTGISGAEGPPVPNTIDPVAGVMGTSEGHVGVLGASTNAAGVAGYSKGAVGVYGETGPTGSYAGLFRGNVHITGNLTFGPLLMAAVPFPDGTRRALYCMESPELCFEDFGSAKLRRGRAIVRLDAKFAKRTDEHR